MPATEEYWRSLPATHKVFAWSSVALLAVTVWMMAADHDDEWRVYQNKFQSLQADKLEAKEKQIATPEYNSQVKDFEQKIKEADASLNKVKVARAKVNELLGKVLGDFARSDLETKTAKAQQGVDRANYDLAVRDNKPQAEMDRLKRIFDKTTEKVAAFDLKLQRVTARRDALIKRDKVALQQSINDEPDERERKRLQADLGSLDLDELKALEANEAKIEADKQAAAANVAGYKEWHKNYGEALGKLKALRECKGDTACWGTKLTDADEGIRMKAAYQLANEKTDKAGALKALETQMGTNDLTLRNVVFFGLGRLGDKSLLPALEKVRAADEAILTKLFEAAPADGVRRVGDFVSFGLEAQFVGLADLQLQGLAQNEKTGRCARAP